MVNGPGLSTFRFSLLASSESTWAGGSGRKIDKPGAHPAFLVSTCRDEKDDLLREIETEALHEAEFLAGEFARAAVADREAILAGLEFERWLAMSCREARRGKLGDL